MRGIASEAVVRPYGTSVNATSPHEESAPQSFVTTMRDAVAGSDEGGRARDIQRRPDPAQGTTKGAGPRDIQRRPDPAPRTTKGAGPEGPTPLQVACRGDYLTIFVTVPAPTVRPPSRMAKPRPSSMAIGWMSSTVMSVVSPGMTISVPSGSVMTPVTSVVRK